MNSKFFKFKKIILFIPYINISLFFIWAIQHILLLKTISYKKVSLIGALAILTMFVLSNGLTYLFRPLLAMNLWYFNLLFFYLQGLTIGLCCLCVEYKTSKLKKESEENANKK